jgi:hypothetical protein
MIELFDDYILMQNQKANEPQETSLGNIRKKMNKIQNSNYFCN